VVIGADLLPEVDSWYGAGELRREVPFIVVGRSGAGGPPRGVEMPAISSTEIRRALAEGKPVTGVVSRAVVDYIYARGLWGPGSHDEHQ
jgi:nicotinic acid mononucleotide adenylyltransferase